MRLKLKYIKLILAVSIGILIGEIVLTTSPGLLVRLNKVVYISVDFLDYYVRSSDSSLPTASVSGHLIERRGQNANCLMPVIDFNNTLAQNFLQSDIKLMGAMLDSCHDKETISLRQLVSVEHFETRQHRIEVKFDLVEEKFGVRRDMTQCVVQQFDKHLNESEMLEEANMIEPRFIMDANFSIVINSSGYFYLCCLNLG